MATKSSYFLAILLIANPFMIVFFQNCSANSSSRNIANIEENKNTTDQPKIEIESEYIYKVNKNLIKK